MATFTRDFREAGADTITDFNPNEDVLDFTSINEGRAPEEFQRGAADRARAFNDGRIVDAQGPGVSLAEVDGGTMISAGGGLIPTFGAVDISNFKLISANTKRLFRSDQSTSAVFLVTGIPRNSFLPNCRSFPNTIY